MQHCFCKVEIRETPERLHADYMKRASVLETDSKHLAKGICIYNALCRGLECVQVVGSLRTSIFTGGSMDTFNPSIFMQMEKDMDTSNRKSPKSTTSSWNLHKTAL